MLRRRTDGGSLESATCDDGLGLLVAHVRFELLVEVVRGELGDALGCTAGIALATATRATTGDALLHATLAGATRCADALNTVTNGRTSGLLVDDSEAHFLACKVCW